MQSKSQTDHPEFLELNKSDLNLYFAQTFLKVNKEYCYVKDFGGHNIIDMSCVGIFRDDPKVRVFPLASSNIEFGFPPVGLYNYKKCVVFCSRKALRQNKKALNANTFSIVNVLPLFHRFKMLPMRFSLSQIFTWSVGNIHGLFHKHEYPEYPKALNKITNLKAFARAISPQFFLGPGIDSKYPSLWFRESLIGNAINEELISVKNKSFLQEALDYFTPKGVNVDASF